MAKSTKPKKPRKPRKPPELKAANDNTAAEAEPEVVSFDEDSGIEHATIARELVCPPTDSRWREIGLEAAENASKLGDLKARRKVLNAQMKPHEEQRDKLLQVFKDGGEKKIIQVAVAKFFKENRITETRLDTNEVITDRAMTAEEREHQRGMPWLGDHTQLAGVSNGAPQVTAEIDGEPVACEAEDADAIDELDDVDISDDLPADDQDLTGDSDQLNA